MFFVFAVVAPSLYTIGFILKTIGSFESLRCSYRVFNLIDQDSAFVTALKGAGGNTVVLF